MRNLAVIILITSITLSTTITGCSKETTEPDNTPKSYMITNTNYFDYQSKMECAAFSSAYVLRFFGEEADGMTLFKDFPNKAPDGGTMPYGIETFFEERGYNAKYVCDGTLDDLKRQIALGTPVIVFIHVSTPTASIHNTHYVPVVGYDEDYLYIAESIKDLANCIDEEGVPYNRKLDNNQFMILWENIDGLWDYPYFKISKN